MDVTDPQTQGLIARWASVAVSAVLALLGLQKWSARRKVTLDARFDKKADKQAVNNVLAAVTAEQTLQRGYFKSVFEQQRQDKTEILSAIGSLTDSFHRFETKAIEELGKRPTRDELRVARR